VTAHFAEGPRYGGRARGATSSLSASRNNFPNAAIADKHQTGLVVCLLLTAITQVLPVETNNCLAAAADLICLFIW
jgi:hypothetical protein